MKITTDPRKFQYESVENYLNDAFYPSFLISELLYEGSNRLDEDPADHYRPVKGVRIA